MADLSDNRRLAVLLVVFNLAARGWFAAGVGAATGFFVDDLVQIIAGDGDELSNIGLIATSGLYLVGPGLLATAASTLIRRLLFARVVWGNAHRIFPLLTAVAGLVAALVIGVV